METNSHLGNWCSGARNVRERIGEVAKSLPAAEATTNPNAAAAATSSQSQTS